jgi:hypothetical protein
MSSSLHPVVSRSAKAGVALAAALVLGGCATTSIVPFTVQSDPLGAHVLYQVQTQVEGGNAANDWIHLGLTPVDVRREVGRAQIKSADAFVLRVMKDGYLDQQKSFSGEELIDQVDSKGRVFWNPRLVPSGQ